MKNLINFLFSDKRLLAIFSIVFLFVVITGLMIIVSKTNPNQTSNLISPTPSQSTLSSPPVAYDTDSTNRMLDILKTRPQLSTADQKVRTDLLKSLNNNSGVLNQTNDYTLEYVRVPDAFMGEIKTTELEKGKQEAVDWLKSKGLSQDGVCNLPLVFYINWQTAQSLRGANILFNPLPNGC